MKTVLLLSLFAVLAFGAWRLVVLWIRRRAHAADRRRRGRQREAWEKMLRERKADSTGTANSSLATDAASG